MLPVLDPRLRLEILVHLAHRSNPPRAGGSRRPEREAEPLTELSQLSTDDLGRLARMRELAIAVTVDAGGLSAGLRSLAVANELKALETYFIRHGATLQMMRSLFKVRTKLTIARRRELGVRYHFGRPLLPQAATCEAIHAAWSAIDGASPRMRYYRLHQAFPQYTLATLAAVVQKLGSDE